VNPGLRRAGLALLLLVAGLVTGLAALVVHLRPWGLPLALVASVAGLLALPPGWWSRPPAAAGWSLAVVLGLSGRPEGDYVLEATVAGYAVLGAALLLVVLAVGTLPPPRRPAAVVPAPATGSPGGFRRRSLPWRTRTPWTTGPGPGRAD